MYVAAHYDEEVVRDLLHATKYGRAHQVGAGRAERIKHLEGAFRAVQVDAVVFAQV